MKNKMALASSGRCRPAGTVPAAHSFSHLAAPLAPVKLGLETSLYTVRGSFRRPEITHSTPASTGTKKILHEALAVCFLDQGIPWPGSRVHPTGAATQRMTGTGIWFQHQARVCSSE